MAQAQVHRFREKVAVYLANGSTVYLTPKEAKAIAKAMNACTRDIKANSFTDSQFHTTTIPLEG